MKKLVVFEMTVPQRLPTTPLPRVDAPNAMVPVMLQPAEDIEKAFRMMQTKEDGMIKPLITFQ